MHTPCCPHFESFVVSCITYRVHLDADCYIGILLSYLHTTLYLNTHHLCPFGYQLLNVDELFKYQFLNKIQLFEPKTCSIVDIRTINFCSKVDILRFCFWSKIDIQTAQMMFTKIKHGVWIELPLTFISESQTAGLSSVSSFLFSSSLSFFRLFFLFSSSLSLFYNLG